MPAPDAAELLRRNASGPSGARPAVRFGEQIWTHAEYFAECCRWANLFGDAAARRPGEHDSHDDHDSRPLHVGVLCDNTPEYLFALGGAALAGATVVGLNHTRAPEGLARDLRHTDVDLVVTEGRHLPLLSAVGTDEVPVLLSGRFADGADGPPGDPGRPGTVDLAAALARVDHTDPGLRPGADARWALVFTSGTSSDPKAVVCSQRRLLVTGNRMVMLMDIRPDDVGYVCMPLFHSNALMVGWAPAVVAGASVALARRFSASGWLPDVRRHGATWFNYTGKPLSYLLSTPERPDDADNTLRVAFGNEGSPDVLDRFAERFGVRVIDAFGSTEGAIALDRDAPLPRGAMGVAGPTVMVVDAEGSPCPPARFDRDGRLANAEECVGEIVNTAGGGPFEGYYNNAEATGAALRKGWYWSGDLGYLDEARHLWFAGRLADWIRVDGENFPAGPIDEALSAHPAVTLAAAYGVPDVQSGDQVMATLVMAEPSAFDPDGFGRWVDTRSGLPPKWRPRFVRTTEAVPSTGTNKVLTRALVHDKYRPDRCGGDLLWWRDRGEVAYRPFGEADAEALLAGLRRAGRERFWDL